MAVFQSTGIEVRNLGLMNWGGGGDGDGISLKQSRGVWVHNNDVFYGNAGSDGDQAKGDGSMDLKDITITGLTILIQDILVSEQCQFMYIITTMMVILNMV